VELFDAAGRHMSGRPIAGEARTLTRATLYRVLQAEARSCGVPIRYGKRLRSASRRPDGGGVMVSFVDGSEVVGDFLVGADGIHSVTRTLIDPAAPTPRYTDQNVIYGYADGAWTEPDAYHMVFGSRAFFGCTSPDGRTWWFARIPGPPLTGAEDPRRLASDVFAGDAGPAAAIVAATGSDVVGGNSYDLPTTPTWHNALLVLAGDAAHAASPAAAQGASMAVEDAVVLANCLRDTADLGAAFDAYEAVRREPAEETVAASARLSGTVRPAPEV
jgi:2-polyprenyl-6-methoxyphenol hydroxylase-like FAD-dependent oxidoreductase